MGLKDTPYYFGAQVLTICVFWYGSSAMQSIINKYTLQLYPYPLTVALSSMLNTVLYAYPLIRILHIKPVKVSTRYLLRTVVPISVGRALAVASAYFSLWRVPVSYAQTVKSTMPVFTVLITRFILHERHSTRVYLALTPIILGVFTASVTEMEFDMTGLISSLLSTFIFSFLNVLAKKIFEETGMHPIILLSLNSQLAAVLLFPVWLVRDGYAIWSDTDHSLRSPDFHFLFLLVISGICSFMQSFCAFALIHQLTTLSYSVSNAAKRIFVILLSLLTFRNPVSLLNASGMMCAIFGVLFYNRVKNSEKSKKSVTDSEHIPNGTTHKEAKVFRRGSRGDAFERGGMHSSDSDVRLLLSTQ